MMRVYSLWIHRYARLFSLDTQIWSDLIYDANIDYRAFHSTATRVITTKHSKKWECYIFGGMYCAGGPYQFHNDEDKETDEPQLGYFRCDPVQYNTSRNPRERSQS
eukprot:1028645_1